MDAGREELNRLQTALVQTISDFLDRQLPLRRIALVASIFKDCNFELPPTDILTRRLLNEQQNDGGWVDCEDTAWALSYIDELRFEKNVKMGMQWLKRERNLKRGWGFCKRDHACIPITAQILYFLPMFASNREASRWLEKEWKKDFESITKLNYKAAWYLLAYVKQFEIVSLSEELFQKTLMYLINEQRNNGSWGPWQKHPAPSDYYSTGICMAALALSYQINGNNKIRNVLNKGVQWLKNTQSKNGLFPTHYIEEGSAWAYWGWSKAIAVIEE